MGLEKRSKRAEGKLSRSEWTEDMDQGCDYVDGNYGLKRQDLSGWWDVEGQGRRWPRVEGEVIYPRSSASLDRMGVWCWHAVFGTPTRHSGRMAGMWLMFRWVWAGSRMDLETWGSLANYSVTAYQIISNSIWMTNKIFQEEHMKCIEET